MNVTVGQCILTEHNFTDGREPVVYATRLDEVFDITEELLTHFKVCNNKRAQVDGNRLTLRLGNGTWTYQFEHEPNPTTRTRRMVLVDGDPLPPAPMPQHSDQ